VTEFRVEKTAQPGEGPSIIFDKVSFSLAGKALFHKLSMTFPGGQCTCVLGPSGCGKSTLLRMISGATSLPRHSTTRIKPECPEKGKIAWMSQNDLLLPWLSLLDNILLGPKLRSEDSAALRPGALDRDRYTRFADFLQEQGVVNDVPPLDSWAVELHQ
jgi:putative hydroxymethylpyrimidine transport system ATP-binding protein